MKKLLLVIPILTVAGSLFWWYNTTTPEHAFSQAKGYCEAGDVSKFMKNGVVYYGDKTREPTEQEIKDFEQIFKAGARTTDCPYKDVINGKTTRAKLSTDELKKLGVEDGLKYTFDNDSSKTMKVVKFNGKWKVLVVEVDTNQQAPEPQPVNGPEAVPPLPKDEDVMVQTETPTSQPQTSPQY